MAQLTDDCFALDGRLLSVEAAAALILARVPPPLAEETVPLLAARGRILAQDLLAPQPLPPFFNSAVDGYAFRHADLATGTETRLALRGRIAAGQRALPLAPGTAHRILTGAAMPPGADTVMMQEDVRLEAAPAHPSGIHSPAMPASTMPAPAVQPSTTLTSTTPASFILLPPGLKRGANCRPAGEDVAQGALALPAGRRLSAPDLGMAAALGLPALAVRPRPRIGVFSTGNELVAPGQPLGPAQTYDSNRFALLALLAGLPVEPVDLGILPDSATATATALHRAAGSHDMLLTSGGVSAGEEDHVRAAIEGAGTLVFWRLALKPGRPAAMGMIGGTPVLGLPGNPGAAIVTFLHLARPLVLRLCGATPQPLPRFAAQAGFHHAKKAGRREYLPVTLASSQPLPMAQKYPQEGAGLLAALTASDAFAELPEALTEVAPGDRIMVLPFAALF